MARKLRADDLFGLRFVSDPRVSPDGRTAAAVVTEVVPGEGGEEPRYRARVHLFRLPDRATPARAAKGGWPKPLLGEGEVFTRSEHRDFSPRFAPDGRHLAFLSVRAKKERPQLYVMPLSGGEPRRLTSHASGVQEHVWHPSGEELYYLSRGDDEDDRAEKGHPLRVKRLRYRGDGEGFYPSTTPDLYAVGLSGEPRLVARLTERARGLAFGPDPDVVYLLRPADESAEADFRSDVVALDVRTGSEKVVAAGLSGVVGVRPSPDGRYLAVVADHRDDLGSHAGVFLFDLQADEPGSRRLLSDLDVMPAEASDSRHGAYPNLPAWTTLPTGEPALLVNGHDGGVTGLGLLGLDGSFQRLQTGGEPRAVTAFASLGGGAAVFVAESPTHPGELWFRDAAGAEARLSGFNDDWCAGLRLVAPEGPFLANGHGVRYWVMRPRRPRDDGAAVLEVHGGPHTAYGAGFMLEFQLLAARGYAVVYGNPRGSSGLGHEFAANVHGDYGGDDAQDVLDIADAALERLGTPDAPLHLTGGSYGGFMTNWLVGVTDRFRSAVSQRSISNWTSMYGTSDIGPAFVELQIGGRPWADLETMWRQSPIRNAANVRTPLLLIHSEEDWRCPIEQAEQFFAAIKRLGQAEVELLRFPGEGHELSRSGRPDRRLLRLEAIVGWFEAHP
ncbi:MAG TPA: S9 family peptidase [Trueperaceae bacterium]|nr:S9 family peptidase [Trueperaceae bacterium]